MINLPFFKKKEKIEYFLALLLRDEKVSAVIFEESSGKVKVIGKHQEYFQKSIEDAAEDEWLDILDKAISTAENSLPSDIETHKTIFGIKENWTDGSKIKKEYLLKLKKVSDALSLSPIGFMVIQEAIAHLMQKEEGVPVSAIFVEVDKKNIAVSLLKMGKIIDTKRLEIEKTIPYTTDQVLHYFAGHEILPSRIVLYDGGENLENLSQEFISHPWSKSLPFLHVPQVSILSSGFDAKAVLFGAATQMGFEMIDKDETAIIKEKNEHTSKIQELNTPEEANESTIQEETSEVNKEEITEEIIPKNNFGFILNKDILKKEIKEEEKTLKQHEHPPEEIKAEEEFTNKEYAIEIDKTPRNSSKNIIGNATKLAFVLTPFKKILSLGISVIFSFKKIFPFIFLKGGTKFILAATALLIFIIAISIGYFFGLKSTITIELKPKIIEKNQPVSFIVDKNSDFSNKIIQGQYVEVSKNGTLSAPATGKKEIGEKAKGNVTIYSRLTSEKTLTAGTVIASSNDLNFTLDSDVKLASSSADASSDPTTAKVGVTAKSIGKEYNLPSNTKFTFGDLPATTIVAKNETAFGGLAAT
ncbi:MAG: baseplate J/gp47 family protein, partial [Patescibacteria group bacterium]|nr:baseplate J/gp47 family protein [Patescibacteria group bacterium]